MKDKKAELDALAAGAVEAEADPDRHGMEEAILATLVREGPDRPFCGTFYEAHTAKKLTFSRADLRAFADAAWSLFFWTGSLWTPALSGTS